MLLKKIQEKEFTPINDLITFVRNTYSFTAITVRRDLKEIAKEGHIKLLHGGIKYINKTQSQIKLLCNIPQTYDKYKKFFKKGRV
ncbi:DeoR family transcriptional regulator [Spiroplasma endosymbiont of Lonchoptera lutea]|uniref:DeoR family transcriptional regulator n=1 Tax=Spiroplasma endosymbiont of Lonchoptera lutea TaxID=3066297 RepID=UPI003BAF6EF5